MWCVARCHGVALRCLPPFLVPMCWQPLQVYSIRDAATQSLQRLAQEFGPEWAKEFLVPPVLGMISNQHYLYRMTVLKAIAALAPLMQHDVLCNRMLPVVLVAAKDPVANVR